MAKIHFHSILQNLVFILIQIISPISLQLAYGQSGGGVIVSAIGEVEIQRSGATNWERAEASSTISAGDVVRTNASGKATLVLSDETLMQLNSNTVFLFKEVSSSAGWTATQPASVSAAPTSSYLLQQGEMWLRNKNKAVSIDVSSPTVSASIRGTEFNMHHRLNQETVLSVLEGSVSASNSMGTDVLQKNEQIIARPGQPFIKSTLLSPNDAVQWVLTVPAVLSPADIPLQSLQGKSRAAEITRIEGALQLAPQDPKLLVAIGKLYRDSGDLKQAEKMAESLLAKNQKNTEASELLAAVLLDQGKTAEAAKILESLPKLENDSAARLAMAQRISGRLDSSKETLSRALTQSSRNRGLLLQQALLELDLRGPVPALLLLKTLTAEYPDYALAWMFRALLELTTQDKEAATTSADKATQLAPESPTALIIKSQVLQAHFDVDQAREVTERALTLDKNYVTGLLNLARLSFGSGLMDEALETVNRAVELAPNDAEARNIKGFILLARNASAEARAEFEQAVRLNSAIGEPHLGLSLVAMRRGDAATALQQISSAVALEPRRSLFLSYWAKMLYELRRFRQALDMLELASDLDPQDPTPHLYKAIILRDLNRPTEAIEELQQAFELNDNRAVYRSSFLLDRDLAVKNIDLSVLYNQLGLSDWARSTAINSVKLNYLNHSAHIFLSGAYSELEARDTARDTELLLAQILLPANNNSFNTYNDYTSFLETPSYRGSITGLIGNKDTQDGDIVVNGGIPELGVAGGAAVSRQQTDGYRETNPENSSAGAANLKIEPTLNDSVFLGIVSTDSESKDDFRSDFEIDAPVDPLDVTHSRGTSTTAGYRHQFTAQSNFIAALQYSETWLGFENHDTFDFDVDGEAIPIDELTSRTIESQSYALQGQYQHKIGKHQFLAGTVFNWGDEDLYSDVNQSALIDGESFPVNSYQTGSNQDQRFEGYYGYHIWNPTKWASTEVGLYYEKIKDAEGFSDTKNTQEGFKPRFGIILKPAVADTVRIAAFQYIVPYLSSPRFDPSDVAGIPVYRNTLEASTAEEASLAWEHSWRSGFASASGYYLDRKSSLRIDNESERIYFDGKYRGSELALNQLILKGIGLSLSYRYLHADDDFDSDIKREDHLTKIALRYLHSSGIGAGIAETFRRENFRGESREDENIWITDIRMGYEFPGKVGSAGIAVNNIFDERFNWVTGTGNIIGREPSREILARLTLNF